MLGWVKYCLEPARVSLAPHPHPPSLHGLISVFLLLGRRTKHEKLVFTILDHPVQHKALFRTVPTHSYPLYSACPCLLDQFTSTLSWAFANGIFTRLSHKNTTLAWTLHHGLKSPWGHQGKPEYLFLSLKPPLGIPPSLGLAASHRGLPPPPLNPSHSVHKLGLENSSHSLTVITCLIVTRFSVTMASFPEASQRPF